MQFEQVGLSFPMARRLAKGEVLGLRLGHGFCGGTLSEVMLPFRSERHGFDGRKGASCPRRGLAGLSRLLGRFRDFLVEIVAQSLVWGGDT